MTGEPVLRVEHLVKHFPDGHGATVRAVDGVSFTLGAGESLGLVGESGCGKSTLARTVIRLLEPTSGRIVFRGVDITHASKRELRSVRRAMSIVFQDPYASLNPRMRAGEIIAQPLRIQGVWRSGGEERVAELLHTVGLNQQHASRFPHEFSTGQRQRIGIARALALDPELLILDEPVSALDVSIRAQIINLLDRLRTDIGLAYLFIAHDLAAVRQTCDRVAVMHLGTIVETGTREDIYRRPTHPYTQALLSSVPVTDPGLRGRRRRIRLTGELPSAIDPPSGCRFRTRCWKATAHCANETPALIDRNGHPSACFYPELASP
ncbi:ABC transporter ATP-binding protein [Haloechinothrix salitolerans]|uniref:ABC transporter ATP-binding protein n=1 Tax=Haloechinothrix salitolerans TaxID=926830 RepID=A0ABW2C0S9_9PSEU